ncbi:hypothetical protein C8T65DRAFT_244806 [Cerioporus squamosus]|nr:hypothetical protein C8T65DRAFT_244806 [Cerioporus squamosus]
MVCTVSESEPPLEEMRVHAPGAIANNLEGSRSAKHSPVSPGTLKCRPNLKVECDTQHDFDSSLEQHASPTQPEADRDTDAGSQQGSPISSPSKRYPYIMRAVSQPRRRRLALAASDRDVDIRERPRPSTHEPPPSPTPTRSLRTRAATPPLQALLPYLKDGSDLSVDTFETCVSSGFSSTPSTSSSSRIRVASQRQPSSHTPSTLDLSSDLFGEFDLPELPPPSSARVKCAVPALDLPAELFEPFALPELSFSSYSSESSSSASQSCSASVDALAGSQTERKVPAELPRVVFPCTGESGRASESLLVDEVSSDHFHPFRPSYAESVNSTYTDSLAEVGSRAGKEKEKWWRSLSLKARPALTPELPGSESPKSSRKLKLKRLVSLSAVRGPERRSSLKEKRVTWDGRGGHPEPAPEPSTSENDWSTHRTEDAEVGFLPRRGAASGLESGPGAGLGLGLGCGKRGSGRRR